MSEPEPSSNNRGRILDTFAELVTRKRAKWLILVVWIVIVGIASPIGAQLSDVIDNDPVTFLPQGAESLQVAELDDEFPSADSVSAVIVYQRDAGLTADDFETVAADQSAILTAFPDDPQGPAIPSEDGRTVFFTVQLPNDEQTAADETKEIRTLVTDDIEGLQVKVTGPAGFLTDLTDVFEGIDTTLLLATAIVVAVLLLITYRSPFLWIIPLLTVGFANQTATAVVYGLVENFGVTVNGQTQGILPILVFGAGTDYALLLIARYREELRRHEHPHHAMRAAIRSASPAILASSGTVIIGLLCLLLADLNSNRALGPVGAAGILCALIAMLTLLPALLLIFGRKVFWPFVPEFGSVASTKGNVFGRVGLWVSERPRPVWIGTSIVLAILALGVIGLDTTLSQAEQFRDKPDAIVGQEMIAESFPAGAAQPSTVISNTPQADDVETALAETPGVAAVVQAGVSNDGSLTRLLVTLDAEPATTEAYDTIEAMRTSVDTVAGANALVGGPDAENLDVQNAVIRDAKLIIPLVFLVVLIILAILLQSIAAPVLLVLTNILSNAAALGISVVVFDQIFGFGGIDPSVILLGFVFLVALGIDYNIFLMSRAHEEAKTIGTHNGMLKALSVTGGVITSAGVVLAATFAVLGVLPLVPLTELGFLVAVGVLIDTLIVRTIQVPALTFDIGQKIWWPSWLSKKEEPPVDKSVALEG